MRLLPQARAAARLLLLILALAAAGPVSAQTAPGAPPPPAAAAPATPPGGDLQLLLRTLRDDGARAALVKQLEGLIAAQRGAEIAPAAPVEPADFVARLTERLNAAAGEVLLGVSMMLDAPYLVDWAAAQLTEPAARAKWRDVILACVVVFGAALLAEWLVRRAMTRLGRRVPASDGNRRVRAGLTGFALLIDTLPIVAFGFGALAAAAVMLPPAENYAEAIRVLVWGTVETRLIMAIAKALLTPHPACPSPIPACEETRTYLLIWVRRFAGCGVLGFALVQAAWWLGAPGGILGITEKAIGFGLAALAVVFVLQNRTTVGRWIAGDGSGARPGWMRLRRHLGDTWHILAIVYIVAVDVVFSLHQEGGSAYVLRATALTLLVLFAARLLAHLVDRASARGLAIAPDLKARFPLLEQRANRYLHAAIKLATMAIYAVAVLAILQAWDLAAFAWFRTEIGRRAAAALLSIAAVLVVALVVWEILSAAIERNLAALEQAGVPARNRRRTLLPLLRTTMLCIIVMIAGLTVLSQLGINIAPLLAGAGVVGLAVGFGSQALVKDVITGLFILIEDQIAVGDIVDLGKEHAGVVEAISIRTIRLRDMSGVVHTVPFSEVTSVKNLTKDFAFVVARVAVSYQEDIDRVVEILRRVCDELAEDDELGPLILDRFDYLGVDSLNEFSVVLLLRVRTLPAKQWVVGRALNRGIKIAFDAHGIAMRDPSPVKIAGPTLAALANRPPGEPAPTAGADEGPESSAALRRTG
jgi:small conductance mechanosensitive channel